MTILTDQQRPSLAEGTTAIDAFAENYADSLAAFATSRGGRALRTARYILADHRAPAGVLNAAVLTRPATDDLPELADEIAARFGEVDAAGSIHLWSPWPSVDLTDRGWRFGSHPPFELRPPGGPLPEPRPGIRVERVTDEAGLAAWERVIVDGFPLEDVQPARPGSLAGTDLLAEPRMRLWLAFDGDQPAAAAALWVGQGLAGFALGATLPEARRRGLWYALVRARLLEEPDLIAASIFSPYSRPGAERIGFIPASSWTLWWRPRREEHT